MNEEKALRQKHRLPAAVILAAAIAAVWLVFELVVFAVKLPTSPEVKGSDICLSEKDEGGYLIDREKTLTYSADCGAVQSISFYTRGDADGVVSVTVSGVDPSNSASILNYKTQNCAVGSDAAVKNTVYVDIPEHAGEIKIRFAYDGFKYNVDGVMFNRRADTSFNFARLIIVWLVIAVICAVWHFKLWQTDFDPQRTSHGASALALCAVCVLIAIVLAGVLCPNTEKEYGTAYPFEFTANYYNPYEQQLDAFLKGQLHIDYAPSDKLLELENPYDPAARDGIYYLWDRAFYDGKYFSYFGIAPIITVYAPYYFLTGVMPSYDLVSTVFTVMTALFFSMAAVKWAAIYTKRLPLPLLWLGTVSALFATQAFLVMRGHTRFYYIATIAGMAFLSLFIWLFLCGISGSFTLAPKRTHRWVRCFAYALAGVAYGLLFLSRYNMALLAAFAIIPMLIFSVATEKTDGVRRFRGLKSVVPELFCLALPVIAAISAQLWLNYARFDSIFEFGTTYQLTVSDVSQNKLRLSDLPYALYHYFMQPLTYSADFPFVSLFYTRFNSYGHYVYIDTGMGMLSIPFMWSLFASVWVFTDKKRGVGRKLTMLSILVGTVAVALMNFCLGGVIYRYTCDLTLIGAFLSMAVIFTVSDGIESDDARSGVHSVMTVLMCASILICVSLAFSLNGNLTDYPASVYIAFRNLFS